MMMMPISGAWEVDDVFIKQFLALIHPVLE
jgi:hypothetical protein